MASNQTTNLGLSQWEADDEVLRADFNTDNAKIDAAVGGLQGAVSELEERQELLLSKSSQLSGTRLRIPLTGIDLTKYTRLVFVPVVGAATSGDTVYLLINDAGSIKENYYWSDASKSCALTEYMAYLAAMRYPGSSDDNIYNRVEFDLTGTRLVCRAVAVLHKNVNTPSKMTLSMSPSLTVARHVQPSELTELDLDCSSGLTYCSYQLWGIR